MSGMKKQVALNPDPIGAIVMFPRQAYLVLIGANLSHIIL